MKKVYLYIFGVFLTLILVFGTVYSCYQRINNLPYVKPAFEEIPLSSTFAFHGDSMAQGRGYTYHFQEIHYYTKAEFDALYPPEEGEVLQKPYSDFENPLYVLVQGEFQNVNNTGEGKEGVNWRGILLNTAYQYYFPQLFRWESLNPNFGKAEGFSLRHGTKAQFNLLYILEDNNRELFREHPPKLLLEYVYPIREQTLPKYEPAK